MATEDRFKQSVIVTLAKRAANRCSNPDCGAITSGPTDAPDGAVNVGEAAHIYGANPGSARYDVAMDSADRSAITNAIWLCGNCHKLIDDDPTKYPAGLLFEWQREHERRIAEQVGKVAAEVRQRYEKRHLEEFGRLSYLAERLIIEKGDYWEYLLTAEVLRYEISPIVRRWNALKRGLYIKPNVRVEKSDFLSWLSGKLGEINGITHAFGELMNVEFKRSWGEPGVAGDDIDIVTTCRLFGEACASGVAWEESVRFVHVDECFDELRNLCVGVAGAFLDQAERIPKFLTSTIEQKPTSGTYVLSLTISLPDGWLEAMHAAMARAKKKL
ncbi:MAG: HNH endonuclease [Betaproteobacteria bacterium]|nr:HNH endonuclease [Betaproteobacteria bacterium]